MNSISFKSRIRPVGKAEFYKATSNFTQKNFVDYPWTVKESVLSNKAYTKQVFDCTVCGITDGLKVLMLHICPTRKENSDFSKITDFIKEKININDKNLQGFLFGSKDLQSLLHDSSYIFNHFEKFFNDNGIPYSKIKGGSVSNDVAYCASTDEWLISDERLDSPDFKLEINSSENFLKNFFDEVEINEFDEIV